MKRNSPQTNEPKLCPNCPLQSFIEHVKKTQVTYTTTPKETTNVKLCSQARALARNMANLCPHYTKTETIMRYIA